MSLTQSFDDCIPRVSEDCLQLLEAHFGMRFSGLGQATARVKKSAGNRAANLVRDLNSAFGCYRHLTKVGGDAYVAEVKDLLAQSAVPSDTAEEESTCPGSFGKVDALPSTAT